VRHRFSKAETARGLRAALASPKTPAQLRPGLKKRLHTLGENPPKLMQGQQAAVSREIETEAQAQQAKPPRQRRPQKQVVAIGFREARRKHPELRIPKPFLVVR